MIFYKSDLVPDNIIGESFDPILKLVEYFPCTILCILQLISIQIDIVWILLNKSQNKLIIVLFQNAWRLYI